MSLTWTTESKKDTCVKLHSWLLTQERDSWQNSVSTFSLGLDFCSSCLIVVSSFPASWLPDQEQANKWTLCLLHFPQSRMNSQGQLLFSKVQSIMGHLGSFFYTQYKDLDHGLFCVCAMCSWETKHSHSYFVEMIVDSPELQPFKCQNKETQTGHSDRKPFIAQRD